ncbi:MAG: DUF1292 domain-containing protein [Lachnospiraceae bacterium]|jgi:uncharacterized protein YrzB (UPF0473 family)|nr:DUF1292 domain-containing protein [Lachnospiraceae bacterium]
MADNYEDMEVPVVTLELDDNTSIDCAIIAVFNAEGYTYDYAALIEVDKLESEDGELYLYRYKELPDDEVELTQIESDEEFDAVSEAFDRMLDEAEFNEE